MLFLRACNTQELSAQSMAALPEPLVIGRPSRCSAASWTSETDIASATAASTFLMYLAVQRCRDALVGALAPQQ